MKEDTNISGTNSSSNTNNDRTSRKKKVPANENNINHGSDGISESDDSTCCRQERNDSRTNTTGSSRSKNNTLMTKANNTTNSTSCSKQNVSYTTSTQELVGVVMNTERSRHRRYRRRHCRCHHHYADQINKLIECCLTKDNEINKLREEVVTLKNELLSERRNNIILLSSGRYNESCGSTSRKGNNSSVISKLFSISSYNRGNLQPSLNSEMMKAPPGGSEQIHTSLRKENLELRRELQHTKEELEECRFELEHEKEKSGEDIKAFGEALRGVDDLRSAAEAMSREINILKNRDDDQIPDDPFEEVYDQRRMASIYLTEDENGVAKYHCFGYEEKKQSLWNKMKLSTRSLNEIREEEDSTTIRGKTKRASIDVCSVSSSFF